MCAAQGCASVPCGIAQGHRAGVRKGAVRGCARAQCGAAQRRSAGLRKGVVWDCTEVQCRAAQSKKKCFSNALRHTLVVLEMH